MAGALPPGHSTYAHYISGDAILTVSLLAVPMAFFAGIGGFDYWFYWAAGRPTRPEDHSGHGAYTWKDYFRVNTDHKVIGIQYTVNSFIFLLIGGLLAMLMRASWHSPDRTSSAPTPTTGCSPYTPRS